MYDLWQETFLRTFSASRSHSGPFGKSVEAPLNGCTRSEPPLRSNRHRFEFCRVNPPQNSGRQTARLHSIASGRHPMPALAPICGNTVDASAEGGKSPKRRRASTNSISSPGLSENTLPPLRRSPRKRKQSLKGLESNYNNYVYQLQNFAPDENAVWSVSNPEPVPATASECHTDASPALLPVVVTQPSPPPSAEKVPNENDTSPSDNNSTDIATDATMCLDVKLKADSGITKDESQLPRNQNIEVAELKTAKEKQISSPLPSSDAPREDETMDAPEDTQVNEATKGSDEEETTPIRESPPSGATNAEEEFPARSKSRLSLLMSLRPPTPPVQSSILRRKCTPMKKGAVYDGTEREISAVNPTSDRHFDALAAFEASSVSPTAIANHNNSDNNKPFVIDLGTLCHRLKELFPNQFPSYTSFTETGRQGNTTYLENTSAPPCIFPRLISCYTIYRDYQRQQENSSTAKSITTSFSPSHERERSPKRPRIENRSEPISTGSSVSETVESLSPIWTLLEKLVDLERIVLEGHEHRDEEEGKSTSHALPSSEAKSAFASCWKKTEDKEPGKRKRRVQFAAFDSTAVVRAPSDVLEGSYKPQDNCVKALMHVLDAVEEIFPEAAFSSTLPSIPDQGEESGFSNAASIVRDFIFYLNNEFIPQCHDTICVESIMVIENQNIPIGRIEKAACAYSKDLDSLINPKRKMEKKLLADALTSEIPSKNDQTIVPLSLKIENIFVRSHPLSWECQLANTSAQMVRYWLRTLMNPIPERADNQTKTNQWKSRLYDCVNLTETSDKEEFNIEVNTHNIMNDEGDIERYLADDEDGSSAETFDDDKLSSLLSNSLTHLYAYLDLGSKSTPLATHSDISWKDRLMKVIPNETCCASTVCENGLGSARNPVFLTDEDWQDVRQELEEASYFCAFHRRALFVMRLLSILEKLNWVDHWTNTVQAAAEKLVRVNRYPRNYARPLGNAILNEENTDRATSDFYDSGDLGRVIQREDEHLILLAKTPRHLLDLLRTQILPLTCRRYEICRANLRRTETNFRLGLSWTKRKKQCEPMIGELETYWKDWLHPDTLFPSISFRGYPPP